jgi:hypothetical protein
MFPERVCQVTDSASGLEATLTILSGSDGGASAVVVELSNPSNEGDLILKVNGELSAFIMLTVTDVEGNVLSNAAWKFDSSETQRFFNVGIDSGSSSRRRVPVAAQLSSSAIPEEGIEGRIVVNVALLFSRASDEDAKEPDWRNSLLTLYDMGARFTRAALSEGS